MTKVAVHAAPVRTTAEANRVPNRPCDVSIVGVETPRTDAEKAPLVDTYL
jgi:hypothetical protein